MDNNHRRSNDVDNTADSADDHDPSDSPEEAYTSIIDVILGESQASDVILPIISGQRIRIIDDTGPEGAQSRIQNWFDNHLRNLRSLTQEVQERSQGWTQEEARQSLPFSRQIIEEGARMGPPMELMDPSPPLLSRLFQQRAPTPSPISSRRSSVLSDSPVSDAARSEQSEDDDDDNDDNDDNDDGIAWLSYEGRLIMSTAGTRLPAQGCVDLYVSEGAGDAPRRLGVHLCRG